MTDEERSELLKSLQAAEADLTVVKRTDIDSDMLAAELRAVRNAVLRASAEREEKPVSALKKGRAGNIRA